MVEKVSGKKVEKEGSEEMERRYFGRWRGGGGVGGGGEELEDRV